jgi:hypothetical protein
MTTILSVCLEDLRKGFFQVIIALLRISLRTQVLNAILHNAQLHMLVSITEARALVDSDPSELNGETHEANT